MDGDHQVVSAWRQLPTDATGGVVVPLAPPADIWDRAEPDVLVVGLGGSGLEAVASLAAAGADVLGVDVAGIAAGAAGANGGFLLGGLATFHDRAVAQHGHAVAVEWYRRTLAELDRLYEVEPTARRVGSLRTAGDDTELPSLCAHRDALQADGIAVEDHVDRDGRAILIPDDGVFDPLARCERLAAEAVAAGATLAVGIEAGIVRGVLVDRRSGRRLPAVPTLIAVDGGLEDLVSELDDRVTSHRLQMLATAPQDEVVLAHPTYNRSGFDYAQQLPDGAFFVGGGRDLDVEAQARADEGPTTDVQLHIERWARWLGATGEVSHRWTARSAWTPDLLPVDERIAPQVHVVGAYSGHGNVIGGMLAREAARQLLEGSVSPAVRRRRAAAGGGREPRRRSGQ